jgi:hypothetical protein
MVMHSEEEYEPVAEAVEESVTACHSLIVYRSSSILYPLRLTQKRTDCSYLSCPSYAESTKHRDTG